MGGQVPQPGRVVVAAGHDPMVIRADGRGKPAPAGASEQDLSLLGARPCISPSTGIILGVDSTQLRPKAVQK